MKTIRDIIIITLGTLALFTAMTGCTKFRMTLPNKTEIVYEKGFMDATAKMVDFYYSDPNVTLWVVVNDPNSSVHPGKLIVPPYFMIKSEDK
jgi:hypothetical protein